MLKKNSILKKTTILGLSFILLFDTLYAGSELPLKITKGKEIKTTLSYDMGLGDNLLQGLQNKIYKSIDNAVNPTINKLKKIQKHNMQMLNTDTYFGTGTGDRLSESWMKFLGFNDYSAVTKDFKEKNKGGIGYYIFNGKKWKGNSSSLNPFKKFNSEIAQKTLDIRNSVNNFTLLPKSVQQDLQNTSSSINKYLKLDLSDLTQQMISKENGKPIKNYISNIVSGKSPEKAFDIYYKEAFPNFVPSNGKTTFTFSKALMPTNNMCEITKCLFGDKSCTLTQNQDANNLKKTAEKIRKALVKRALLVLVQKLIKEFFINEYIQFVQRSMVCSVEATMSTTSDTLGFNYNTTTGLQSVSSIKFGNSNNSGIATTNSTALRNSARTVSKCLSVDDTTTKNETNIDIKASANEQGQQVTVVPVTTATYIPFIGLGGGATFSTEKIAKKIAALSKNKACILKGKMETWKHAFNNCMTNGEIMKIKINSDLKLEIQKLFGILRRHKKIQCQLSKKLANTNRFHFSLLKYSDLIPTIIESEYNKNTDFMKGGI